MTGQRAGKPGGKLQECAPCYLRFGELNSPAAPSYCNKLMLRHSLELISELAASADGGVCCVQLMTKSQLSSVKVRIEAELKAVDTNPKATKQVKDRISKLLGKASSHLEKVSCARHAGVAMHLDHP